MSNLVLDVKFKILYAFQKLESETEYIIELKRLDLNSDAPLSQKFRWIIINASNIESLSFVSRDKIDSTEYRKFIEGEFNFDSENGEFCYSTAINQKIPYKCCIPSETIEPITMARITSFLER
jgi:hypothetical protein